MNDQYILASNGDYSGSYTDDIYVTTMVKQTNLSEGLLLHQITHSWTDGVSRIPDVFYTFDNTIADSNPIGRAVGLNLTFFTSSTGATQYDPGPHPGMKAYAFDGRTILSGVLYKKVGAVDTGADTVFGGKSKQFTIEFLMKPKSRTREGYVESNSSNSPRLDWDGNGFKGVGSMYDLVTADIGFSYDANSRGMFGIFSSKSSTHKDVTDATGGANKFFPKSIFCYGHDLIEHPTLNTISSLHGSRTTGYVYDDGDWKTNAQDGRYNYTDNKSICSVNDFDSKRPQTYLLDQWQYVVITRDTSSYKVYVNGELIDKIENKPMTINAGHIALSGSELQNYAPYASITFGINPEVLWRIQAAQDVINGTPVYFSNPAVETGPYSKPWHANIGTANLNRNGWPGMLRNISSSITTLYGESQAAQGLDIFGTYPTDTTPGAGIGQTGPSLDAVLDTLMWSGSLSHWRLYQGAALDETSIKKAYDKIFVPTYSTQKIKIGSRTDNSYQNTVFHDQFSKSDGMNQSPYYYDQWKASSQLKNIEIKQLSLSPDLTNGTQDVLYSSIIGALSSSQYFGKNNNFIGYEDVQETYYDSLVPAPVDYHEANGAQIILLQSGSKPNSDKFGRVHYSSNTAFALPIVGKGLPDSFLNATPAAEVNTNLIVSGSTTLSIGDVLWPYFFPFEAKYKGFSRLKKPSNKLTKNYTAKMGDSGSVGVISWITDFYGFGAAKSSQDGVLNSPVSTNIFSGMLFRISTKTDRPTSSDLFNTITNADFSLNDTKQFINNGNLVGLAGSGLWNKNLLVPPDLVDTYKTYYGVGRKYNLMFHGLGMGNVERTDAQVSQESTGSYCMDGGPGFAGYTGKTGTYSYYDTGNGVVSLINSSIYGVGAQVAGWKYGLYSAIPTKNKVIFRRDHFGHMRDMLEQRPFTKFSLEEKNTTTASPIKIRFVADSQASLTSSLGLDPNDSGIYHYEYASGKPFIEK